MGKARLSAWLSVLCACVALVLCGFFPVAFVVPAHAADALMVGVPADRCPVFYVDAESGELTGIGVDLMRAAAEEAGYDATFTVVSEPSLKEALDSARYDVVMPFGSAITSGAGKESIVSDNLIQTPFTLVTEDQRDLPDLNELHVGMLSSLRGGAETVRELYPGMEISFYETMPDAMAALRAGEVDALLHNSYVWSYVLQKPAYADLRVQPAAMFSMDFRAGTLDTPQGRQTIARLDEGIAKLSDTKRQAIVLDHSSRRLYRYDFFDYLQQYGLVVALLVLLFASLTIITIQRRRAYRLEQEEKMRWLMDHDSLTGALSADGFKKRVAELLGAHPDVPYLLCYINIKEFKYVNDSLGRQAGDDLLQFWVSKTQETLSDMEAVGRLDGDHFAVLRHEQGEDQMRWDDSQVIESVRNYFVDRGKEYRVHICGGIYVLTPEDYVQVNVDRMLDYARTAERRVRDTRDDGYELYNPDQWNRGKRTAEIIARLPFALRDGEVEVWYQPQVDYRTGEIVSAEALCRWKHVQRGWLSPAEFIPALEEHGLIYELDNYVWERVCADLRRWNQQGQRRTVSVNLSRNDIREGTDIPAHFRSLVESFGLDPEQLHVEITETAFVEDPELLIRMAAELRALGFRVEMDDFGSGHSSLNMLKEVQVDRIKLDLRFLSEAGDPERGRIIVSHVIHMVDALGMQLIAEGVESEAQARFLEEQGCHQMQGFYFYRPMEVAEFERVVGQGS